MILLPLLVKEKVEYYYYFDKWKDSIKIMNQEYRKRVSINDTGAYTILVWYKYHIVGVNMGVDVNIGFSTKFIPTIASKRRSV
jgi:hypothetical protein